MTKDQIKEVVPKIVEAIQSDEVKSKLDDAGGDLGQILGIVMEAQAKVLQEAGVDPMEGLQELGKLKNSDDPELKAIADELKAATEEAKS